MKSIIILLTILLLAMQYKLWLGDDSVREVLSLRKSVEIQQNKNHQINQRNEVLAAEVEDLKSGLDSIEARARSELGMIKEGETFIHIVESKPKDIAKR